MRCRCCCRCRIRAATIPTGSTGSPATAARRWNRSKIRWSTGWRGARSPTAPARLSRRAPRAAIDCNRGEEEVDPAVVDLPVTGELGAASARRTGDRSRREPCATDSLWRRPISSGRVRVAARSRPIAPITPRSPMRWRRLSRSMAARCCSTAIRCRRAQTAVHRSSSAIAMDTAPARASRPPPSASRASTAIRCSATIPYAGGWIVERHGAPRSNVHALQIEIDRRCYLGRGSACTRARASTAPATSWRPWQRNWANCCWRRSARPSAAE